jgi:3-deoxy-D-manno-octulosonate 8-phosphate phosphatase (KDO 8-P phosphatase)
MQNLLSGYSESLIEKARNIKALITDVDGVLTNGTITYDTNGIETKSFNVKDGLIVKYIKEAGIIIGLITGRASSIVEKRSKELKFDFCYQGSGNKIVEYEKIKEEFHLIDEEIAYLGDDLNDVPIILRCGLGVVPYDSMDYIKKQADLVTRSSGGNGVLREVADLILAAKGEFNKLLK